MKNLIVWLNSIINKHKALKRWRRVVTVLAAIMTFVTTYALILPAITVEKNKVEDVGGMYLEQEADTNDMLEENALEPIGVSIAAEHENAVTFAYADDSMTATAVFGTNDEIPAGAELVVTPIDPESVEYTSLSSRAAELLDKEFIYDVTTCSFYDFALVLNNVDVTPKTGLVDIQIIFHDNTVEHLDDTFFAGRFARSADDSSDVKDELVSVNPDESSVIELADGIITVLSLKGNDLSETDSLVGILAGNVDEEIKAAAAETDAEIPDSEDAQEESAQADSAGTDGEEAAPKVGTLKASGSDYTVTLTYDATSEIPEGASLTVSEIAQNSKEYKKYLEETKKAMGLTEEETLPQYAARFFDIKIMVGGDEFVPESGVTVEIAYTEPLAANPETEVNAVHFHNDTTEPEVIEANVTEISSDGTSNVEFTAEAFSVYGVVYTVDFHWEVDGKVFDCSIPGGGFVSFSDLVEVLGIARTEGENEEIENSDTSVSGAEISEATKQFVACVERVEFSNPNLVWVGKADEESTVSGLKNANGLIVNYSARLTAEQIAEINAQTVNAGDWALISLQPFDTEETLTVTMKTGEAFILQVTDAQLKKTVISASGEAYDVTVTYDGFAQIPDEAVLEVTEFGEESEEYKAAREIVVREKESQDTDFDENSFGMVAFDISILDKTGVKVEPQAPVNVSISIKSLPEETIYPEVKETLEIQHLNERLDDDILVETVASVDDGNIQTSEDAATAEFLLESFSTFTVGWSTRATNNSTSVLRWLDNNTARGFLTAYYTDENGNAISRPNGQNGVGATVDYNGFGNGASHTFNIDSELGKNITNYTYQGAYIIDQEGNKQRVTSVKGERLGEVTTITYYNGSDVVISKSYDATGQERVRHNFDDDNLAMTLVYESNNHTTVHYGYMEDGVFKEFTEQPNPTDTSTSDGWAYLLYDFHGTDEYGLPFTYNYVSTYYKTSEVPNPTTNPADAVAPVLRYNNAAWRYYSTNHGYEGSAVNNNSNWTSVNNDSHLYVVYEKPPIQKGGSPTLASDTPVPDDPEILKQSKDNGDGTNTLSLNITGSTSDIEVDKLADVIVVLDLSSSMQNNIHNNSTTGNGYTTDSHSRYYQAKQAVLKLANNLYQQNTDSGKDLIRMGLVTFAGTATVQQELTDDKDVFLSKVNAISRYEGKGTNWEYAIKKANEMSVDPGRATFVIFVTDGEPTASQSRFALSNSRLRSNIFMAGTNGGGFPGGYNHSVHYDRYDTLHFYLRSGTFGTTSAGDPAAFTENGVNLSGDIINNTAAYDDAKSIVDHNKNFYVIAISEDVGVDALHNILDAAGVPRTHGISAANQTQLTDAFNQIESQITGLLGWGDIKMTDGITDLTNTVAKAKLTEVDGNFTYYKASAPAGWENWTSEQKAAYKKGIEYADNSDNPQDYGNWTEAQKAAFQSGKAASFDEWTDEQRAAEGCEDAFYDEEEGAVKWNMGSTFMLEDGVTYRVSFICWPTQEAFDWLADLQNGTRTWADVVAAGLNCAYDDTPEGDNPQIINNGDGTYTIVTNKKNANTTYKSAIKTGNTVNASGDDKTLYFDPVRPMPLNRHRLNVLKEWEATINTAHEANSVTFHLLVDGKYYMADGSFVALTKSEVEQREMSTDPNVVKPYKLIVTAPDWQAVVDIAPGVIRDEDVLEEGHSYTLEEFASSGTDYFSFNYEFTSRTVRPMNVNAELKYLVQVEEGETGTHSINGRTYNATIPAQNAGIVYFEETTGADGTGTLKGINSKTSELDITKMIDSGNTNLTDNDLDEESFTYRITLDIPAGSNISGITGYCYFEYPNGSNAPFKLFGYQQGETALASDIERFGGKELYRSWNTTNTRIQEYLMTTNQDGSVTIKMDLTLTRKQVLRFTNLPTGTQYTIEEVYANYYRPAGPPPQSVQGEIPHDGVHDTLVPSNLSEQGYTVSQIVEKNSNQTEEQKVKHTRTSVIRGTISETDTRYYNQFTNKLENLALGELKVTKHLEGYEWSGEKYYFKLTPGTAEYTDITAPATGTSPMPGSSSIYLSNASGTADKTYTFGKIRYLRPGTYVYTITETDADGRELSGTTGENGITYAPAETVTVTVGYDNDGYLAVQSIVGSNGNTVVYSASDSSAVVAGTTTFTNSVIGVKIRKTDIDKKTQLSGAVFELILGESKLYFDSEYKIMTSAQVERIIELPINNEGAAAAMEEAGITSSFTIGEVNIKGLSLDTAYVLNEKQPPDGYIIAANDATFTLSRGSNGVTIAVTGDNVSVDEDGITIIITNEPGAALPNTGGPGTRLFTILGSILILGAGVLLWRRRRTI